MFILNLTYKVIVLENFYGANQKIHTTGYEVPKMRMCLSLNKQETRNLGSGSSVDYSPFP